MEFQLFLKDLNSKNQTGLRKIMIRYNIYTACHILTYCVLINDELQRVVTLIYML